MPSNLIFTFHRFALLLRRALLFSKRRRIFFSPSSFTGLRYLSLSEARAEGLSDLVLIKSPTDHSGSDDTRSSGSLPVKKTGVRVRLRGQVREPCVMVSTRGNQQNPITFHLPVRTKIYLSFIRKAETEMHMKAKEVNDVVETVTEETFTKLQKEVEPLYGTVGKKNISANGVTPQWVANTL